MSAIPLQPPAAEPWTVAEAKQFLRVDHDVDDALIATLIAAARGHVEALSRRALLTQRWRVVLDRWPVDGRVELVLAPLRALLAARLRDPRGEASPIALDGFAVDVAADMIAAPGEAMLLPTRQHAGIELDVELGYGAAAEVPPPLRHAVLLLVAHWYEHRGVVAEAGAAPLPAGVSALIAPFRRLAL